MRIVVFDIHKFERASLELASQGMHELLFIDTRLSEKTALLAKGFDAVSLFVNDDASRPVLEILSKQGVR